MCVCVFACLYVLFSPQISGLSQVIADKLSVIETLGPEVACLVVVIITCIVTEVTSNTVIATLFMPILAQLVRF